MTLHGCCLELMESECVCVCVWVCVGVLHILNVFIILHLPLYILLFPPSLFPPSLHPHLPHPSHLISLPLLVLTSSTSLTSSTPHLLYPSPPLPPHLLYPLTSSTPHLLYPLTSSPPPPSPLSPPLVSFTPSLLHSSSLPPRSVQYINRDLCEEFYTLSSYPEENLYKKVTLLKYFRSYMSEHLLKAGGSAGEEVSIF